jgi:murein DD-endopeptidase MepM/ murein hydrolase activator NlpD
MPRGTEITSVTEGIAKVGYNPGGYGKYVTITYALNEEIKISFLYAHCNTINVVDGQEVKRGDIIATVGSTGKSTGNHLHLTYMIDGAAYNPEFYLE